MPTFTGTLGDDTLIGTDEPDIIDGGAGADTIYGRGGDDVISGGDGNDVIEGGDGADTTHDGVGNDTVLGGAGNDMLRDGAGSDTLDGGAGDDVIVISNYGNGSLPDLNRIDGGAGFDILDLSATSYGLTSIGFRADTGIYGSLYIGRGGYAGTFYALGIERLITHATLGQNIDLTGNLGGFETLTTDIEIIAGSGADSLRGGLGRDILRAGAGEDILRVGVGDSAYGEVGDDVLNFTYSPNATVSTLLDGGDGIDELRLSDYTGQAGIDMRIGALPGNASFSSIENLYLSFAQASSVGRAGSVIGTDASNRILVNSLTPGVVDTVTVDGGGGDDFILAVNVQATLNGGDGNDTLQGGVYDDVFNGGDGDDIIRVAGNDTVSGGAGIDLLDFTLNARGYTVDMIGGTAQSTFNNAVTTVRFSGVENLNFGGGADVVTGNDGANIINGNAGDDVIRGGGGGDTIDGGEGADFLYGDAGDDILIALGNDTVAGGEGTDTVRLGGRYADYRVSFENGATVLTRANERVVVTEVERFEFADGTISGVPAPTNDIFGTSGADRLTGTRGGDRIIAGDGNDFLIGDAAGDVLDGGAGIDTAGYFSVMRAYTFGRTSGGVTSVAGGVEGGTDLLTSIERLSFLDGTLYTDADSNAARIHRLYDAALDRPGDQAGLAGWVSRLDAGTTLAQAAQAFATAPEFVARYGNLSNEDFVRTMYRFSLNREGDAFGVSQWTAQLNSGVSRGDILLAFSESVEHRGLMAPSLAAGVFVQDERTLAVARLFDAAFDRLPDREGIAFWRGTLDTGGSLFSVANAFVSSQEFQDRYGALNNQQFIDQLYRFTLNREADGFGRQVWIDRLNSGTTRAEMVVIFSESAEHVALTAPLWQGGVRYLGGPMTSPVENAGLKAAGSLALADAPDAAGADDALAHRHDDASFDAPAIPDAFILPVDPLDPGRSHPDWF